MQNSLSCDRCGHTEDIPSLEILGEVSVEIMRSLIQERFFVIKRTFGGRGWSTSIGYDLCPDCCKATGNQPGYHENNLFPETIMIPRMPKRD